ncbi:MAG: HAMP domain-containing histidine kinase [Gemmatimonadetes bacterium]|nr:HAMP domain-containing histidine kinase [Gemmatimonadota bacterium]MBT6148750.1 HAMP domain-containing histidine kinase [Gemmatimonadota bacterium]MBT7864286.1 HAMP domain-containing histidine kinase [Gemmatimonadota bacterium]
MNLNRFYLRLSAILLVLLLTAGIVQVGITLTSYGDFVRESDQRLNHNLAENLAKTFHPFLVDSLDTAAIGHVIHESMAMNPFIEIYVLDESGQLRAYFADPSKIKRMAVDIGPVRAWLTDEGHLPLPWLGDDPRSVEGRKPFSAAPILVGGEPGFLYVILGGELYDSAAAMIRESYILRATATSLAVVVLCAAIVGVLSFLLLTRRLRHMTDIVRRFRQGDWAQRVRPGANDELGELGAAFDEMADTIVDSVDQLKQSDLQRREMIANISHDLRSPLTSVQGYIETILLRESDLSTQERREYLQTVSQNVRFLNRLVNELFELSKLESGQSKPTPEIFSIEELAHDVTAKYRPMAEERHVHLMPPEPQALPAVRADISMIERTLDNLIENALRFTPAEGEVSIQLHRATRAGDVQIDVADTGIGISADELPHIFDRFYRVRRHAESTGLGLAISQRILEAHERSISVSSRVDEGTTFSFSLPFA